MYRMIVTMAPIMNRMFNMRRILFIVVIVFNSMLVFVAIRQTVLF